MKSLVVGEFPRNRLKTFQMRMKKLGKLTEKLNFLEEIWMVLSSDMQAACLVNEPGIHEL